MPFVTLSALQENLRLSTGELFPVLITVEHEDLAAPIRLASPVASTFTSRGDDYEAVLFDVQFGSESPDEPPSATAKIDDVSGLILAQVLALDPSPTLKLEIVSESEPDDVQYALYDLTIEQLVREGVASLSFRLSTELLDSIPFPGVPMTRDRFPALYTDL